MGSPKVLFGDRLQLWLGPYSVWIDSKPSQTLFYGVYEQHNTKKEYIACTVFSETPSIYSVFFYTQYSIYNIHIFLLHCLFTFLIFFSVIFFVSFITSKRYHHNSAFSFCKQYTFSALFLRKQIK